MVGLLLLVSENLQSRGMILQKVTERRLTKTISLSSFKAALNSLRSGVPTSAPTAGFEDCNRRPNTEDMLLTEQSLLHQLPLHLHRQ